MSTPAQRAVQPARAAPPSETLEGREFLQRRLSRIGLLLGGVGLAFYAFRVVSFVAQGAPELIWRLTDLNAHLGGALLFAGMGLATLRGELSVGALRRIEFGFTVPAIAAYGFMIAVIPQEFRPDHTGLLINALYLLVRAVYIPGGWRSVAALAVLLGGVLGVAVHTAFTPISPRFASAFGDNAMFETGDPRSAHAIVASTLVWWTVFSAVAAVTAQVVHGLRTAVGRMQHLGQYRLVRRIGEGGMGVVWEARHAMLKRPAAIKLIKSDGPSGGRQADFEREVQATARLTHPNIVTVFDYGRTMGGVFYYVMELLDGADLRRVLDIGGPLPATRVVHVLHQIASALEEAHRRGLIHRDIKLDNIRLCEVGGRCDVVKIVDFGLVAELALAAGQDRAISGTPRYLAPETIRGTPPPDGRTDLYSLGVLAYLLLGGIPPFEADTITELCRQHLEVRPASLREHGAHVPAALEALVSSCLAKSPDARPESAGELRRQLEALELFGAWSQDEARRWWHDFGPELREAPAEISTQTLPVDLSHR